MLVRFAFLLLVFVAVDPLAHAQAPRSGDDKSLVERNELEEIVVSARRKEEPLTAVPASITAYTSDFLQKQDIQSFADYATRIPNLTFQYGQGGDLLWSGDRETTIRGVAGHGTTAYHINDTPVPSSVSPQTETSDYQFEAELVIAIGKEGAAVPVARALDLVYGYAVGLDMTRRDRQFEARDKGRPWDVGKNFAYSSPIAEIRPVSAHGHVSAGPIRLAVNGQTKQAADISDLIWNCAETIAYLSRFERLLPGDLIYTGTPAGVGPVNPGDIIDVTIAGLQPLKVTIGAKEREFAS